MELLNFHSSTDIRIVNIVGSPGFGKSTLAIHVGNEMVKQGIVVHYINMAEYQVQDSSVQETLSEKILKAAEYTLERYDFQQLKGKFRSVFWNTLIIIDNCDDLVHNNNKTKFFNTLETMVEQTTRLKILITSREVTTHLEYFKRYPLYELSKRASCELIEQILPVDINATTTEIEQVANLTGNAPLALQIIGALLSSPNPPLISQIVNELDTRPISLLSSEALEYSDKINVSISLSYRYLSADIQKISQYLANFPGSFTLKVANEILNCTKVYPCDLEKSSLDNEPPSMTKTLDSLLFRSLIEFDSSQQRYMFHRLIKEFLKEKQLPQNKDEFNVNFQEYYSSLLGKIMITFDHDYKLALQEFDNEKHNYQKLLDDLKANNHEINSFLKMLQSITQALEKRTFRVFSFSDEEIITALQSALKYIEDKQLLQQKKQDDSLVVTYISIFCKIMKIKADLTGIEKAVLMYNKSNKTINFITKSTNESKSSNDFKIKVYEYLVELYKAIGNKDKVTEYYSSIYSLKGELTYFDKIPSSVQHLVSQDIFFFSQHEHEQSAQYFDLAFKQIELLPVLEKFDIYWKIAKVYFRKNQHDRVEKCHNKLQAMLKDDCLTPTELYEEKSSMVAAIKGLKQINLATIADRLKDILIEATLDIESRPNVVQCSRRNDKETLHIIEDYFKQKKYSRTIEFGEQFLKNIDLCHKQSFHHIKIQSKILIAKAIFWGQSVIKGMDQMEQLYPIVSEHKHFESEYFIICKYLIPRLRYIGTCYPEVYSIPRNIAMATVIGIFIIPPYYEPSNQKHIYKPPVSTVPEITMHSPSKTVATRGEFELTMANYTLTPFYFIKFTGTQIVDYIIWVGEMIIHIYSQYSLIRFIFNVATVFIRLYLLLAIVFFLSLLCVLFCFGVFIKVTKIGIIFIFKFPRYLLFPSTLIVIHFVIWILETLFYYTVLISRYSFFILFVFGSFNSLNLDNITSYVNSRFE